MKPMPKNAPSIKDAKPKTSTPVKYDSHMGVMAPRLTKKKVDKKAFDSNFS